MRISLLGLGLSFAVGCTTSAPVPELGQQSQAVSSNLPMTSGSYQGHYVVPAPSNLASAATFAVSEVDWTVAGSTVTLHYDLPVGLVGGDLSVSIGGGISSGATTVHLTSTIGVGSCTASGTKITCSETFGDLGTLPINMAVVQQTAAADPTVTVANRVAVANIFSSDPIGTVDFDLNAPADDHGGGHGGGGGGKGRH